MIPSLSPLLIDADLEVRNLAKTTLLKFVDIAALPQAKTGLFPLTPGRSSSGVAGAAAGVLGWVFSKFGEKQQEASAPSTTPTPPSPAPVVTPTPQPALPQTTQSTGWDDDGDISDPEPDEEAYSYPVYHASPAPAPVVKQAPTPASTPGLRLHLPSAKVGAMKLNSSPKTKSNPGWDELDDDEAWDFAPAKPTTKISTPSTGAVKQRK